MGIAMKLMAQNRWQGFCFAYVLACAKFIFGVQERLLLRLPEYVMFAARRVALCASSAFLFVSLSMMAPVAHAGINTGLSGDDRYAGAFPIGFTFQYYGVEYTQFYVSTNGLIQFTNPTTEYANSCLTGNQYKNTIYVFWDDLRTDVSGQPTGLIHYQTIGEAPNRQLIVQWTNMYFYGSNLPMGTFQAILSEGTNTIQFQYRYLIDARSRGNSATVGMQGEAGQYVPIGCNQEGQLRPEQTISFTPDGAGGYVLNQNAPYSFVDISGLTPEPPVPSALFTNQAPSWSWQRIPSLNTYEIQVQNLTGEVVHAEVVGDVNTYTYAAGAIDGGKYTARVRGSINNGGTWEMWSGLSAATTVDLTPPTANISSVTQTDGVNIRIGYAAQDSLSGLQRVHMRVASDRAFTNLLLDQHLPLPLTGEKSLQLSTEVSQLFIALLAVDAAGNESATDEPFIFNALPRPVVTAPTAGAIVSQFPIALEGSAYPGSEVAVYLNGTPVKSGTTTANGSFLVEGIPVVKGTNTVYVVSRLAGNTSAASETVTFQFVPPPPAVTLNFAGEPLLSGAAISEPGVLAIRAESMVGIARIQGSVNGVGVFNQTYGNVPLVTASQYLDFAQLPNGSHTLTVTVTDGDGVQTVLTIPFTLSLSAPPAPVITSPTDGATVGSPQLTVAGTATAGTSVQVFVDGQAAGGAVAANSTGSFGTTITLGEEGAHQLTAIASSARGESAMSAPVNVTYSAAVPTVAFITPAENSTLTAETAVVEASASDASGITKLELYAAGEPIATCAAAACSALWSLEGVADGNHTLRAVATNTTGRTAEATRTVTVQKAGDTPPQPLALYEVQDFAITPAMSFGDVPIKITGQLVSTAGREPAASAALLLLLRTHGVDRRINLRSDANGRFDYSFVPQSTDAGTYEVRITHSDDAVNASRPADGSFTINRLSVDMSRYRFDATRGQTSIATVRVTASAGTGATGVHWKALPADQPSGSLPPGITLETGDAIDIAAGTTAPINIRLAGSDSAGATGTIILKLFANESGSTPRAELRLDYQLHEAQPRLVPDPTSLQLGVQQGATASAQVTITNKGFKPAHSVRAALQARPGHALPSWVKLISSPDIGALDVGASTVIQINASPDTEVPDGYHYAQLVVSADNDAGGSVPITIAVAREGEGNARFQFVDIYTGTTDEQGNTIEGLAGARITLQHETLSSDIRSTTSNAQGIAEFEGLPPGNWRWRASAPGHIDASGRITINATATTSERVFLDYQLVTVEFSVTETTIQDVYDIVLEATYQTQVPAPVVVLEPTSINLPAMQQGEEITGELRLTNYGLVRADHLRFALPGTDENFKYEFFAELPEQLPAKSSVSIPYRITSLKPLAKGLQINLQADNKLKQIGADQQSGTQVVSAIRRFLGQGDTSVVSADTPEDTAKSAAKAASCTSYHTQACASYDYECASGDVRGGSTCASIGRITGTNCTSSSIGSYGGSCNTPACGNGGGWGGGGWGGGAPPMALVPACMPSSNDCSTSSGGW